MKFRVYSRTVDNTPPGFDNSDFTAFFKAEFDSKDEAFDCAKERNSKCKEGTWGDYVVVHYNMSDLDKHLDILYTRGIYDKHDDEFGWKFSEVWLSDDSSTDPELAQKRKIYFEEKRKREYCERTSYLTSRLDGDDQGDRETAVFDILKKTNPEGMDAIIGFIKKGDLNISISVAKGLQMFSGSRFIEYLIPSLSDENPNVRRYVAATIELTSCLNNVCGLSDHNPRIIKELIPYLKDKDPEVQNLIKSVLAKSIPTRKFERHISIRQSDRD